MYEMIKGASGKDSILAVMTFKGLVLRWAMVLFLAFGVCIWTGCAGDDDSDNTEETDDGGNNGEGASGDTANKTGVYEQDGGDVTETGKTYDATGEDESAVFVYGGGIYSLTNGTLTKTGDTSGSETSNFYGNNAIVLAQGKSEITLSNCTLTSDSEGSNGAFAYEEDTVIYLYNCTISTTGNSSRGVDATYGGEIYIYDSQITTTGDHCGALATDRYENTDPPKVTADNVTANTAGDGSPGIYCTGTFYVSNSTLTATGSEAAAIEGLNSITLEDTDITGKRKWGVMIYQSMSGDSSEGTGTFSMTGGTLTNNYASGPAFFVCDTDAVIELDGATIDNDSDMLLVAGTAAAAGNVIGNVNSDWGTLGGTVTFTATNQTLAGKIILCDSSSSIDLTLTNSNFTGSINNDNIDCTAELTIDAGSTWTVTGDSYLSSLTNNGTITGTGNVYVDGTQVY